MKKIIIVMVALAFVFSTGAAFAQSPICPTTIFGKLKFDGADYFVNPLFKVKSKIGGIANVTPWLTASSNGAYEYVELVDNYKFYKLKAVRGKAKIKTPVYVEKLAGINKKQVGFFCVAPLSDKPVEIKRNVQLEVVPSVFVP